MGDAAGRLDRADEPARQFDFWLGDWEATWAHGGRGRNRVRAILGGGVVLEEFDATPGDELQGMSVSVYDPGVGGWRQTWVDNAGSYWSFLGGFADGQMVLSTSDHRGDQELALRMVFHDIAADEFDWSWQRSTDGGATWTSTWEIHYRRRR
jgi:Protein of unknown function (DUF1579)